jgi:hypothetical protein
MDLPKVGVAMPNHRCVVENIFLELQALDVEADHAVFDAVMMFKILVIQAMDNLSD